MANPEQVELLKKDVIEWNDWRINNPNANVDLSNSDLSEVDLIEANLSECNLSYANLVDANLRGANLYNANLYGAYLYHAFLGEANLQGANFDGAEFFNTQIGCTNLNRVNNLHNIVHRGPSDISTRTFAINEGVINEQFLKGIGLNDWEIKTVKLYQPNLTPSKITDIVYKVDELKNDAPVLLFPVFLSHSWKDKEFVRSLYDYLQRRGVRCWLDEKQLKPGNRIIRGITEGIKLYDKTILICSEHSLKSVWVERELERILAKEYKYNHGKPEAERVDLLIPITLDEYVFQKWDSSLKTEIERHVIGDFKNCKPGSEKFEKSIEHLIDGLRVNPKKQRPPSYL